MCRRGSQWAAAWLQKPALGGPRENISFALSFLLDSPASIFKQGRLTLRIFLSSHSPEDQQLSVPSTQADPTWARQTG